MSLLNHPRASGRTLDRFERLTDRQVEAVLDFVADDPPPDGPPNWLMGSLN